MPVGPTTVPFGAGYGKPVPVPTGDTTVPEPPVGPITVLLTGYGIPVPVPTGEMTEALALGVTVTVMVMVEVLMISTVVVLS